MSSNHPLSAIARRKAAQREYRASLETINNTLDTSGTTEAPVDTPLAVPLKRKTSALSIRESEAAGTSFKAEKQNKKKYRAENHGATQQASTSSTPQRAYSPSQPVVDSSDEGEAPASQKNSGLGEFSPQQESGNGENWYRPARISGNMFNPVNGQNLFSISAEQVALITGESIAAHILIMQPGESLLFVGTMRFALLQGVIELMGTPLSPSRIIHRIFAPRSHPIPTIWVPLACDNASTRVDSSIASLFGQLPQHIRGIADSCHSVVLVQELVSGIEGLGRVIGSFGKPFEPDPRDSGATCKIASGIHILKAEPKYDSILYISEDWRQALNTITSPPVNVLDNQECDAPVVLVKGGKNTGKSTFAKILANSLLNSYHQVAFVECDLGQSEFTPGGMVSLNILVAPVFGPAFTHLSIPRRAHFIGGTSPKTSPSHYLSALNDLSQYYQLNLKYSTILGDHVTQGPGDSSQSKVWSAIPLVVNTQGWIKGMGADLLRSIEQIFQPTHIIDLRATGVTSNPNTLFIPRNYVGEPSSTTGASPPSIQIPTTPIPPALYPSRLSASDLRNIALISYFHGRFASTRSPLLSDSYIECWDTNLPLRGVAPIVIDRSKAIESISIIAPGGEDIVPSELSKALVCGIVGLVAPDSPASHSGQVYIQGGLPPSPQTSRCIGLGFVRGISDGRLQLLTPTPTHELRTCRNLVLGELSMPIWGFLDVGGHEQGLDLPFLQWGRSVAEGAGGERRRIRRNIMRRGQA